MWNPTTVEPDSLRVYTGWRGDLPPGFIPTGRGDFRKLRLAFVGLDARTGANAAQWACDTLHGVRRNTEYIAFDDGGTGGGGGYGLLNRVSAVNAAIGDG